MSEEFFENPESKPVLPEASKGSDQDVIGEKSPIDPIPDADFMSVWDTETEYRETKSDDAEPDAESDDETIDDESFEIDDEAIDFAADLAVNANQEGMARILHWMHDEGDVDDYKANNETLLRKAWKRFFAGLNIRISNNKGILFANLLAFGWSLGIGIWKVIGRVLNKTFVWPWKRKPAPEPEPVFTPMRPAQPVRPEPKPKPNPAPTDSSPETPENNFPDVPLKVCKATGEVFKPGTGYPVNPSHEHYDQYASRGAYQTMLNNARKKKSNAKKESENSSPEPTS